ncbi:MAG: leucine-rich repeat domain-containing protein [Clostridiales bacterium]|nr:leucine-rich repeat domain-containing protein [Clostridiales bacterium]
MSNDNIRPFKKHKFTKKFPWMIVIVSIAVTAVIVAAFLVAPKAKKQLLAIAENNAPAPVVATPTPLPTPTPTTAPGLIDSFVRTIINQTPPPLEQRIEAVDAEIYASFFEANIDDDKLALLVASGEIPIDIQSLELGGNQITQVSSLSSLKNLKKLSLAGNCITDASPLASLESLEELSLSGNSIEDMSFLQSMPSLKKVELDHSQLVASASAINNSSTIKAVDVDLTQDGTLANIGAAFSLHKLSLDLTKEVDADIFKQLTEIENLDLKSLNWVDLSKALAGIIPSSGITDSIKNGIPDSIKDGIPDSIKDGIPDSIKDGITDSIKDGIADSGLGKAIEDIDASEVEKFVKEDLLDALKDVGNELKPKS